MLFASVRTAYSARLAMKNPTTIQIMGDPFFEGRTTYNQFALAYDFVCDFIIARAIEKWQGRFLVVTHHDLVD